MNDEIKALLTIMRHRETVADFLTALSDYFRYRAREHDRSKLKFDEFAGFARINVVARNHAYGTPEYDASMEEAKKPGGCIHTHFGRNAHHPEFHQSEKDMGLFDLMEMVIDWKAASMTYGTNTLAESLPIQLERFNFERWQEKVIREMVKFVDAVEPEDTEKQK